MDNPRPRFTGIFIPAEILEMEELSPLDQMLISWIDALYCVDHGGCYASNEYLSKRLRVKENTIVKALCKLRKIGLIEDVAFNGRQRVIRAKIADYVEKTQSQADCDLNHRQRMTKITPRVGQKSQAPLKTYIYENKDEFKEKRESRNSVPLSEHAFGLADFLFSKIQEEDPNAKPPNREKWAKELDRMHRIDGYSWEDIKRFIEYAHQEGCFWKSNILCPSKLRKHATRLVIDMKKDSKLSPSVEKEKRIEENMKFAEDEINKIKAGRGGKIFGIARAWDTWCEVKVNGNWSRLAYVENGFREQFINLLRKGGHI